MKSGQTKPILWGSINLFFYQKNKKRFYIYGCDPLASSVDPDRPGIYGGF